MLSDYMIYKKLEKVWSMVILINKLYSMNEYQGFQRNAGLLMGISRYHKILRMLFTQDYTCSHIQKPDWRTTVNHIKRTCMIYPYTNLTQAFGHISNQPDIRTL